MKLETHHIIIIALLIINIGFTIWSSNQAERLEILKVGGQENWNKLQQIMNHDEYKNQYSQNFDALLQQIENPNMGFEEFGTSEEFNTNTNESTIIGSEEDMETIEIMDQNETQG